MKAGMVIFGVLAFGLSAGSILEASPPKQPGLPTLPNSSAQPIVNEMDSFPAIPESPSESKAFKLSLIATIAPVVAGMALMPKSDVENKSTVIPSAFIGAGIIIGPSVGYFYGDCGKRGGTGIAIRVGTLLATAGALSMVVAAHENDSYLDALGPFVLVVGTGAGIIIVDVIYDIAHVRGAVWDHKVQSVAVRPRVFGPSRAPGLELSLRF